jgi:hypothetical protein
MPARQRLADRTAAGRQSRAGGTFAAGSVAAPSGGGGAGWARCQSRCRRLYGALGALRRFPQLCACTGGPSLRSAWRLSMGWPVWNWGEGWAHLEWVVPIGGVHCVNPMA